MAKATTPDADNTLGTILTLAQAAERLQITKHLLARAARDCGRGALFGRDLRFTEDDLVAILQARQVLPSRSLNEPSTAPRGLPPTDSFEKWRRRLDAERQAVLKEREKQREAARIKREAKRQK